MRIMHISNNYTPYSGGVVSSLNALLPALQSQGHEVELVTLDFAQENSADPTWVYRIPSLLTTTYKQNRLAIPFNPSYALSVRITDFKPDIIHVHHPFLLGAIGKNLAYKHNIPCVFTYHTMYEHYAHYIPGPAFITKPLIQKMVLSFCKDIAALITPSYGIKHYLQRHEITVPLYVIPSPLQNCFFGPIEKKSSSPIFNLLYVGRFTQEKNIACLIELFNQLNHHDYRLTLVGYGAKEMELKKLAYDYYNFSQERVQFVIKPEPDLLRQLYKNADLFLFPSQTDTQGLVLAESMACGTPVLAFAGHGQHDIITQGVNGFIVKDKDDMVRHIEMIKNDQLLLQQLSDNAYVTSQVFSQGNIVSLLIDVYTSIM